MVTTITERCRVCYTCVRECPAKAIRIADGQAEVITERCIGCGNCVRVCSQQAKKVMSGVEDVEAFLAGDTPVAACLAPSFAAEFEDIDHLKVVGMVRALGFDFVGEVAFGADLVARAYAELLERNDGGRYIATSCPAIIGYVEKYHPGLVPSLAPIVSPMVATARVIRSIHEEDVRIVFIGPCIAKKGEVASITLPGELDGALTFVELRGMLDAGGITPDNIEPGEFDEPHAGLATLFPISRGMLQAAGIDEDLAHGQVVAADGRQSFVEAIKEFETGDLDARLLEVLACNGCIMGAGMSTKTALFSRRSRVAKYTRHRLDTAAPGCWEKEMERFAKIDLSRTYVLNDQRMPAPYEDKVAEVLARMGKFKSEDELNCGACGYDTCRLHAVAILKGLAESEMCLPYTIDQLKRTVEELAVSHEQLASAQAALLHSEKLASMGQLAAGIAHEVNNPLGVVLMYAHLLLDEYGDNDRMREDLSMIAGQADRCKKIVSGLLHFARQNKVVLQRADLCELVRSSLRSIPVGGDVAVNIVDDTEDPFAEVDRDQLIQVISNLVSNAVAAMPEGGLLKAAIEGDSERVSIRISDTGVGIPQENIRKIYEPFFTTKQIGRGTGLGLAVTYGIVKMHRGEIEVVSNADSASGPTGTTFTVTLPRKAAKPQMISKEAEGGENIIG